MDTSSYKSPYVWPNDYFPFRHYYNSNNLDVFIIENIMHNYIWLKENKDKITNKHFFFVICGWFHDDWFAKVYSEIFEILKIRNYKRKDSSIMGGLAFVNPCNDSPSQVEIEIMPLKNKNIIGCKLNEYLCK